jgi:hypothetical protein
MRGAFAAGERDISQLHEARHAPFQAGFFTNAPGSALRTDSSRRFDSQPLRLVVKREGKMTKHI